MNKFKLSLLAVSLISLSGCSIFQGADNPISLKPTKLVNTQPVCVTSTGMVAKCKNLNNEITSVQSAKTYEPKSQQTSKKLVRPYLHSLQNARSTAMLGEYIEQLSMDLIAHLKSNNETPLVGVTSIVEVSSNLSTITPLSNVLTEEFITELQHQNIYVVDYKITNGITVSPYGEFVFYRNSVEELSEDKINHVLAGTLTYTKQGIIVNARVVEFESKKVISSAKKLIPYFVFDSVITS